MCSLAIALILLLLQTIQTSALSRDQVLSPLLLASGVEEIDKTGCYIVVVKEDTTLEQFQSVVSQVVPLSSDSQLHGSVYGIAKTFTVKLSDHMLNFVRSLPEVDYVEEETIAHGTQTDTSERIIWHVDRLDQHYLPLDNTYQPYGTGQGVDIYILDTGVNYNHEEFESRAEYGGYDPTDVAKSQFMRGRDCHGHGTHVASLAAGRTYGAAKKARIYSIRVLDCTNSGRYSTVIDGLDYVARTIPTRGRPAVVSMSLSGSYSRTVDNVITNLHNNSIIMIAAAGNDRGSACDISPGSSLHVITVGGSSLTDGVYYYTNSGPCVDVFAPGASIKAADYQCVSCSTTMSGTSMAVPKVSGIAAIHLEDQPDLGPDDMKARILSTSTPDILNFSRLPLRYQSSTSNRLLYIGLVECLQLTPLTNGSITGDNTTEGSVVFYSCDDGFALVGSMNRTCQNDQTWSGSEPSCVAMCPQLSPVQNGRLNITGDNTAEGSVVVYSCDDGFALVGSMNRTCQNDQTWSGIEPSCVAVCPQLPPISNGDIAGHHNTTVDSVVSYLCDDGFVLIGPANRTCQSNRAWSGSEPSCVAMCPQLSPVQNGMLSITGDNTTEGSVVIYSCDNGFALVGSMNRTCQNDQTWSGSEPSCVAVCPQLPPISNGDIAGHYNTTVDSVVSYLCDDGFVLIGPVTRTCQSNRAWSGSEPLCVAMCPQLSPVQNGRLNITGDNTAEGSVVTYSCDDGFALVGSMNRTCQNDHTWSGSEPSCVAVCPQLPPISNGDIAGHHNTTVDSVVSYLCDDGFVLIGPVNRTCQSNRAWSGSEPSCVAMCPQLSPVQNGTLSITGDNTAEGSVVLYSCDDGFALVGSMNRTCQNDHTWSGSEPSCDQKSSPSPSCAQAVQRTIDLPIVLILALFIPSIEQFHSHGSSY